ncbi:MAG: response regulator transcription factor [Clostridiales bacterium]|nr:response regulator transcription factor [Clostridiales bacterium]
MLKLLVVDDEEKICALIRKYAVFEGHSVDEAGDGLEAIRMCKKYPYDLVIMDIMMPELDGFSACREIRRFSDVPIIMLSARGEEYDKINGFELGIDDYVVKPFSPKELMLRIEAITKRATKSSPADTHKKHEIFEIDGLRVDFTARIVYIDGQQVNLSPKEYDLLFYLIRNRNIALAREKLLCEVWGYDFYGGDRTLDTHIKLLRKSLGEYSRLIVTLRGVGYRFDAPR